MNPFGKNLWEVPIKDRINAKVSRAKGGCWVWTGKIDKQGYARIGIEKKEVRVHRVSYEAFVGQIPTGLQIDHLCRNRACVNPAHLEPVTARENARRGWLARRPACPLGHEMKQGNKARYCPTCRKASGRAMYRKHREKVLARVRARYQKLTAK